MISITTALFAAFLLLLGPSAQSASAQLAAGVQGSWGSESDLGVGARALVNIAETNFEAVGSFNLFFPDADIDWFDANANLFYHFHLPDSPVLPYLGGGLNASNISNGDSTTEIGLNLGGGLRFEAGNVTPFVEGRAVLSDADQFVLTAGLLLGPALFR